VSTLVLRYCLHRPFPHKSAAGSITYKANGLFSLVGVSAWGSLKCFDTGVDRMTCSASGLLNGWVMPKVYCLGNTTQPGVTSGRRRQLNKNESEWMSEALVSHNNEHYQYCSFGKRSHTHTHTHTHTQREIVISSEVPVNQLSLHAAGLALFHRCY